MIKVNILLANLLSWRTFRRRTTSVAESAWIQLKLGQKRRKWLRREDIQSYLDERMCRQWRGGSYRLIMRNFLAIFPLQFPTDNPVLKPDTLNQLHSRKKRKEKLNITLWRYQELDLLTYLRIFSTLGGTALNCVNYTSSNGFFLLWYVGAISLTVQFAIWTYK